MEDHQTKRNGSDDATKTDVEKTDCSIFEFNIRKKTEEKPIYNVVVADAEGKISGEKEEIVNAEATDADDKKGLLDKIKDKLPGQNQKAEGDSTNTEGKIAGEKEETVNPEATDADDKKGLLEKIKDKLPGQHKKAEEGASANVAGKISSQTEDTINADDKKGLLDKIKDKLPCQHKKTEEGASATNAEDETKEKKGILDKIKEKMPGCHKNEEQMAK